ncbi:transposase [Actinoplanes sp. CA-030573]|uniref:transposase n=1 Tax=Actinoplanes sp. CA-030573 TaxID=3239898 RepID=UPI003D9312F1
MFDPALPARSSGRTTGRHRLSRSGDCAANSALYILTLVRIRHHDPPAPTSNAAPPKASANARSSVASSGKCRRRDP